MSGCAGYRYICFACWGLTNFAFFLTVHCTKHILTSTSFLVLLHVSNTIKLNVHYKSS